MSHLKLKQIAGPSDGKSGSVIVFDNSKPSWSTDLTTSLQIPTGTSAQRPQSANPGMIRYNSTTGKVEAYEAGVWKNLATNNFAELADGPGPLQAGKGVRVNTAGTGMEFFQLGAGLTRYRFLVTFSSQDISTITGLPNGWTYSIQAANTILLTHNLGVIPSFTVAYGRPSNTNTNVFTQRMSGAGAAGALGMQYDISNLNICYVTNVTPNATSAAASGIAYIDVYFLLS